MLYREMDRAQLDAAYNNSAAVPERDAIERGLPGRLVVQGIEAIPGFSGTASLSATLARPACPSRASG